MARFMLLMFDKYKEETGRAVAFYTADMAVLPEDAEIVKKLVSLNAYACKDRQGENQHKNNWQKLLHEWIL